MCVISKTEPSLVATLAACLKTQSDPNIQSLWNRPGQKQQWSTSLKAILFLSHLSILLGWRLDDRTAAGTESNLRLRRLALRNNARDRQHFLTMFWFGSTLSPHQARLHQLVPPIPTKTTMASFQRNGKSQKTKTRVRLVGFTKHFQVRACY